MPHLEVTGLAKRFGEVVAVDGVDLALERGEFLSLLGPSGCGKTTTLHMIGGFQEPSAGRIVLGGRDLRGVKPSRRNIGLVFQSYALFPHMTVAENVAFGLEMRRVPKPERAGRVARALDLVRLSALGGRYPRALSGGQQQRVALARALVIEPDLLLLDEPLSSLDAKLREEMRVEIREIQRRAGVTAILVTHDQAEALVMSDRVAVMNRGRIVQVAAPAEAYDNPADDFVSTFLGRTNLLPAAVLAREAGRLRLRVGTAEVEMADPGAPAGDAMLLSIRPERLAFSDGEGQPATVRACLFLGDQWLYELDCALGPLLATRPNLAGLRLAEGSPVRVTWPADAARLLPGARSVATHG